MSYEDSFQREADDEQAYDGFERMYIYENFQPAHIGKWEWDLMFNKKPLLKNYTDALRIAAEMAKELGRPTLIEASTFYSVIPDDYWDRPPGSVTNRYQANRFRFIKALVVEGRYPDLVKIADEQCDRDRYGISRHFSDTVRDKHRRWIQDAG